MKVNFKKQIAMLLAATTCLSVAACDLGEEPTPPDYSSYSHRFNFYCYAPPNAGTWKADDGSTMYAGEDYRTVERYKEYKDCGFDTLMVQSSGNYQGENFETSNLKMVMDRAYEAGIEQIIVTDNRLQRLSEGVVHVDENGVADPTSSTRLNLADVDGDGDAMEIDIKEHLVGEDRPFATEADLDEYVAYCMAPYMNYPGFYGVQLKDEPNYRHVSFYGDAYRAVKRVCPDAFVQYNLNQIYTDPNYFYGYPGWEGSRLEYDAMLYDDDEEQGCERYAKYLEAYIDQTGADYIMWDSYPLKGSTGIREQYIRNLQVTAEVCKEKGVAFANTTQTESELATSNGAVKMRKVTEEGARWLNNMLLGFGVKQIVYYTYFNKGRENASIYPDGTSFITHYGEKTELYYFMQKIIAEDQKFAPVILNFDYVTSNVYTVTPSTFTMEHVRLAKRGNKFQKVESVIINKECALATELYDKENDQYMYMIQNVVDPKYQGAKAYQTATVQFSDEFTHALVYRNGEPTTEKLQNGKLTVKQHPGEAVYVLPY